MVRKKAGPKPRSGSPLNASVEMLGDRWSLLIILEMMLQGARTYKTLLKCYEGIAGRPSAEFDSRPTLRSSYGSNSCRLIADN